MTTKNLKGAILFMKKNKEVVSRTILFLICSIFVLTIVLYLIFVRCIHVSYTANTAKESNSVVTNPYCGFYQMGGYMLSEKDTPKKAKNWSKNFCQSTSLPLVLLEINLKNYANKDISPNAIEELNAILNQCKIAKKQVILRFLYDWDGKSLQTEPSHFEQIKTHIGQVSSTVNQHSGSVYILQGVFVGNHAEMHHTKYGDTDHIRQLMGEIATKIDASIFLAVRTPAQLRSILNTRTPLDSSQSMDPTLPYRLGLFNDGMLGSVYDLGTYDDTPLTSNSKLSEAGTREEELSYQNKLCQYVPNGGEVTLDNSYNDLDNAISDLTQMHVSYLNKDHDLAVLNKWKKSTYQGDGVFSGTNGYQYIQAHLGYRYVLTSSKLDFDSFLDDKAKLKFTISNTGFAPSYKTFETSLFMVNEETGKKTRIETTIDNTSIAGNDESHFQQELDIRSFKKGTYRLELEMKDPFTKEYIHFSNQGYETSNTILLGTITIK